MKSNICFIIGSLLFLFIVVSADDNDDECLICDAMIGAAVAVCQEHDACRAFMSYLFVAILFISLLTFILGEPETRRRMINDIPSSRRVAAAAGGYGMTRMFM